MGSLQTSMLLMLDRDQLDSDITPLSYEDACLALPELARGAQYGYPGPITTVDEHPYSLLIKWSQTLGWEFVAPLHFALFADWHDISWEWLCMESKRDPNSACPDLALEDHDFLVRIMRERSQQYMNTWESEGPQGIISLLQWVKKFPLNQGEDDGYTVNINVPA